MTQTSPTRKIDTTGKQHDMVNVVEIRIGDDVITYNHSKAISMYKARALALSALDILTGDSSSLEINIPAKSILKPSSEKDKLEIPPKVKFYRHKKRGSRYAEIADGILQVEEGTILIDGDVLKAYVDDEGRVWFRELSEFNDGRFEELDDSPITTLSGKAQEPWFIANSDILKRNPIQDFGLGIKSSPELIEAIKRAREWYDNATPEERNAMIKSQMENICTEYLGPTDGMGTVVKKD